MRQLIDLLRQISSTTTNDSLRQVATDASRALDRGVVSAAAGESI